jgi:hypothetical protein
MVALIVGFACAAVSSQEFYDPFNYKAGTTIPGYTEQRGDWMATGTAVQSQSTVTFQELVNDTYTDLDCCVETTAIYDMNSPNLMYTGPLLRYTGSGSSQKYIMIKLQDNSTPRDGFDRGFTYFCSGGSSFSYIGTYFDISPATKRARVRLQAIDQGSTVLVHTFVDTDMDGKWDIVRSATTGSGLGQSGKIGICGYRNAIADDLKFFNATLYLSGTPQIGTAVKLPGRASPSLGYIGACSFGNSGFPVGGGKSIPLSVDPLLILTATNAVPLFFQNFQGRTDAQGDFTMVLNIPQVPALVGNTIWASAVTLSKTGAIAEVAPDVEIAFTK